MNRDLWLLIIIKKAFHSIEQNAIIVLRAEKKKGRYGPLWGIKRNLYAIDAVMDLNTRSNLMYFMRMEIQKIANLLI